MGSTARRPNIVLVMTDQQKATSIGLYGNRDVRTPALEGLAGDGLLYQWAFTPQPLCIPARVSVWTGRYPHQTGSRHNRTPMPLGEPHGARLLRDAGYRLALIGKNHCFQPPDLELFAHTYFAGHTGPSGEIGSPGVAEARAFYRSHNFVPRLLAHAIPYTRERCAGWLIADRVIELLELQAAGLIQEPLCIWMSIPDPHPPYAAPQPYASAFEPESIALPPWRAGELEHKPERQRLFYRLSRCDVATEVDLRRAVAMYYAQIAFADDCLGRVLSAIDRLGQREQTIVAFTSDHGDFAGEHRMMLKSGSMYDCLTRVPLVVSWPGTIPSGRRQEELVSTLDLVPSLLTLAGVRVPAQMSAARPLPGLRAALGIGEAEPRGAVFAEYGAGGSYTRMSDLSKVPPEELAPQGVRLFPGLPLLQPIEGEGRLSMVRTHRWKYVYDPGDPLDELYDLAIDPWELENVARHPDKHHIVQQMRRLLLDWSITTADGKPVPLHYNSETLQPTQEPQYPSDEFAPGA
jgi:arylsulfatase A-like enzyme